MQDTVQPGQFYLGRRHDLARNMTSDEPLLYDSDDLTTHAVVVGMTGSGKTGLGISLLEEAALSGVPAIVIDPKGDLGNLLLVFPELSADDFKPWLDPAVAGRQKISLDRLAATTAESWKKGLAKWGEDGERIRRFKDSVDAAIYTPGSSAGLPLTVLKSFSAPSTAVLADADALGDRLQGAASGLLTLLGIDADAATSREHILLLKVLETAWRAGRDLNLVTLITEIQRPKFDTVGAVPLESFLPAKERDALAMRLNNLLASPSFASWLEGEPLNVENLLWTTDAAGAKKPRLSIISIAHLGDAERMFFVTLLLNEVISWMRNQPGTSSLKAILYMDEVFGYFPPSANPPAKRPMLTLLKQARAYGLGCVLATQNPVDLDYKGLSNAGTWFLGRLQTERDKLRVLEGLEGASAEAGAAFDRQAMERTLAGLGKRVFLMNNVHEDKPQVFETRWALSYLAGPLTRAQIATLMKDRPRPASMATAADDERSKRPLLSGEIPQKFWPLEEPSNNERSTAIAYRPALLGSARIHFVDARQKTVEKRTVRLLARVGETISEPVWDAAERIEEPALVDDPAAGASFAPLPAALGQPAKFKALAGDLQEWLVRHERLSSWTCPDLGESSRVGEDEAAFRKRAAETLQKLQRERLEQAQASAKRRQQKELESAQKDLDEHSGWLWGLLASIVPRVVEIAAASIGGRRSRKQMMTVGIWERAMRTRRNAAAAKRRIEKLEQEIAADEQSDQIRRAALNRPPDPASIPIARGVDVAPRKSDVDVDPVALVWLPCGSDAVTPAYEDKLAASSRASDLPRNGIFRR